jgi:hypothetical protein
MTERLIPLLLTCGPLVLTVAAWIKLYWARQPQWPRPVALVALSITSANAAFAAGTFLYYQFRPSSSWLPPWQDPQILQLALLFLLAPIGMIVGAVAGARGAAKWLIRVVEVASLPLLAVGIMACAAV